ncbi:MAG: hypothetical protein ACK5M3_10650 [Dysgonomonas sp.]
MKVNLIKEILDDSKKYKKLISIYIYGEEGFYCGYVEDYNDVLLEIVHYTKYGKCDGTLVLKLEDIFSIDCDDDYGRQMSYLIANTEKFDNIQAVKVLASKTENWQYDVLKKYVLIEDSIVNISVGTRDEDSYMGHVLKLDNDFVLMRVITNYGFVEGPSLFRLQDISAIRVNDSYGIKALLLYQWRKEK